MFNPVAYNVTKPNFTETHRYISNSHVPLETDFTFQFEPNILTANIDRKSYDAYLSEYKKLAKDIIDPLCLESDIFNQEQNLQLFIQEKSAIAFGFYLNFEFKWELDEQFVSLSAYRLYVDLTMILGLKHQQAMWLMSKYLGSRAFIKHVGTFPNEEEIIKALGYSPDLHCLEQFIGENCPLEAVIRTSVGLQEGLQAFKNLSY